jgi:hypothetical protein
MMRRLLTILALTTLALGGCAAPRKAWVRTGFKAACAARPLFAAAAEANGADLDTLAWSPFGAEETGWRVYAPRMAIEIGTPCAPDSQAFAARLARWQSAHGLAGDGRMSPALFERMKAGWQAERAFVALRATGVCPDPPGEDGLAHVEEDEALMEKPVLATPGTLKALRRMRKAARRQLGLGRDPTLAVFSAFRSPDYDAERCVREQNCNGVVRAQCSAHRTGRALDLLLGAAPGYEADSSAGPNRLFQTETPAYRWLAAKAKRYGFVNYVFEPWHWEWSPKAPQPH